MNIRFKHEDGTGTSFLSSYSPYHSQLNSDLFRDQFYHSPSSYLSVGTESGVNSIFSLDRSNRGKNRTIILIKYLMIFQVIIREESITIMIFSHLRKI